MRLITFSRPNDPAPRLGIRVGEHVLDVAMAASTNGTAPAPAGMKALLAGGPEAMAAMRSLEAAATADRDRFAAPWLDASAITWLPPIPDADKFLCVGKNYRTHLEELQRTDLIKEMPEEPTGFVKLNSCLAGHEAKVVRPRRHRRASTTSPSWCS